MTATDPTLDFLAQLDDPARYAVRYAVPVFRPHRRSVPERRSPDGRVYPAYSFEVTEVDLSEIVANAARAERSGVLVRITPGHVNPFERDERQLPPPWGFYRRLRVGAFGPSGEPAILADEYTAVRYADERATYPYRSGEYLPGQKRLVGVALLRRDPYLDLGVVCYAAEPGYDPRRPNPCLPPARPAALAALRSRDQARRNRLSFVTDAVAYAVGRGVPPDRAEEAFSDHLVAVRAYELYRAGGGTDMAAAERLAALEPLDPAAYAGGSASPTATY